MANDLIRIRRDTYVNWEAADPVLALGEISYDRTNHEIRVGNGTTSWLSLPAIGSSTLADGDKGDITVSSSGSTWTLDASIVADIASKLEASSLNFGTASAPASTALQIRRGTTASWAGVVLQNGELGFDTQINEIRIGDGTSTWENLDPVGSNKFQNLQLDQIGDVTYDDLAVNDVLTWNGAEWINDSIPTQSFSLDDLTSVTLTSPTLGQILQFNGTIWVNAAAPSGGGGVTNGVKNDITVVDANDWQITANSIETAMIKNSNVTLAKIGGAGVTTAGKQFLGLAQPTVEDAIPVFDSDASAWTTTEAKNLVGPISLETVLQLKDSTNGLLGISNQGVVDQSFLGSNYIGTSRQVLGTNSWLPENLYQNNTVSSTLYSDGRSVGTWALSALTTGSVLFDPTAIITAWAATADSTAAIKAPTTVSLKDINLEFTARVRVRGSAPTSNTNYLIGFYELSPSSKKYAAIKAGATNWESVIKSDGTAAGTTTASSVSALSWTDVKITILNNEIKTYVNNTLLSTSSTEAFTALNLGCVVYTEAAAFPQPELEVEYMRLNAWNQSSIHPRLLQSAGATTGQALAWSGSAWTPQTITTGPGGATNLDGLSDVTITSVEQGNFLWYSDGVWKNNFFTLEKAFDVAAMSPSDKQPFVYDGSLQQWTNAITMQLDSLIFNTTPNVSATTALSGKIYWDTLQGGLVTPLSGNVVAKLGFQTYVNVWNNDMEDDIPAGRAVRVTGRHGQADVTVALANASSESTAAATIGFSAELIGSTAAGLVITSGLLRNINTNLIVNGATVAEGMGLWLDTISGEVTVDRPTAPNHGVFMGWLVRKASGTAGEILVKVINGQELDELHNVLITTPLTGHVLKYNGTVWANSALAISDVTGLQTALDGKASTSHTHAASDITSGTIATARLGSGTADNTTFLRGDNTWQTVTSGGAPVGATYIVQTSDGTLTNEQALGSLGTGLLKNTTSTGVLSIATGSDLPTHNHTIADVTNLQTTLDGKAASSHTHAASAITSGTIATARLGSGAASVANYLRGDSTWASPPTALDQLTDVSIGIASSGEVLKYNGSAWANSSLAIADVTNLQTTLNGKAAASHNHAISDVTGLQTALDGKAAATHSHAISDVTGLQTALDGKASTSHTHAAGDITSGVINVARLGTGTPSSSTYLRGDGAWETVTPGSTTNLDGLTDVTITSVGQGDFLWYDSGGWVNAPLTLSKIYELSNPVNGQVVAANGGAWTTTTLNGLAEIISLDPIGITTASTAGRFLVTSKLNADAEAVSEIVHGNFIDTATIDATFEDRSVGTPTTIAKWKFDVKDSSLGTAKLGGDITAAGKALLDDADAAAQRTTLGLGTAATLNTSAFAAASHTHAASDITSGTIATARLGSGTADNTTFLRGDNTWQTVSGSGLTFKEVLRISTLTL